MTSPEPMSTGRASEIESLKTEINSRTSTELIKEFLEVAIDASRLKNKIEAELRKSTKTPEFIGEKNDKTTEKGKADNVRIQVIKMLLLGNKNRENKITPQNENTPELTGLSKTIIEKVSEKIRPQDVTEQEAPFLYELFKKTIQGEITDTDSLVNEYKEMIWLQLFNDELYSQLKKSLIEVVVTTDGISEEAAEEKFFIEELNGNNDRRRKNGATYEERKEYEELNKDIQKRLAENIYLKVNDPNKLSSDERMAFMKYYYSVEGDSESLESAIKKLGLEKDDLKNYSELFKKIFRSTDPEHLMVFLTNDRLRNLLTGACNDFSMNELKKNEIIIFEESRTKDNKKQKNVKFDKQKFKKMITKYHFQALEPIHDNTSQFYDQAMSMNASQYQYYFGGLQGVIENLCDNLINQFQNDRETVDFLKDVRGRYQGTILTYAQTFHNLPLYAKDAGSFEKWPQFLGQLFPSELAEIFDPDDRMMEITRQEVVLHLRRRIALNKNTIPSDLFSGKYDEEGVRYSIKDMEEIENNIKARIKSLRKENVEEWEYKRARTYAIGVGLASLTDPEVISTADPDVDANFKGIYPLVSQLSAKHNWGLGRGYPLSGLFPHLLAMEVTLFPEQRGIIPRLFKKKSWVPESFDNYAKGKEAKYGEKVFNELLDREHSYQELLNMLNISTSTNSRMGWGVSPLIKVRLPEIAEKESESLKKIGIKDQYKWGKKEWDQYFDLSMKIYGNSSLWWMIEERTENEMKRYLAQRLKKDIVDSYEFKEYNEGEHALKKEFEIVVDARGTKKKFTFPELRMMKMYQIIGETFYRYLHRNPADFIMLLSQISPELFDSKINYFFLDEKTFKEKNKGELGKTKLEIEKQVEKMQKLRALWGDEAFLLMGKVRAWIFDKDGLVEQLKGKEFNGKRIKDSEDWKIAMEYFSQQSGTAFERMLQKDEKKTIKNKGINYSLKKRGEITDTDFDDKKIRSLIFSQNGLFNILEKQDSGGFNEEGKFEIGHFGLFYHIGEIWTLKQARTNPFSPDLDHFSSYKYIGEVGEDIIKRRLGDASTVSKLIVEISHLDEKLQHVAESRDLKEIFEIHKTLYSTLKNVIGSEYAHRANYILASVVTQYFYEHSNTRVPFFRAPFNLPLRWSMGKKISLSKILGHSIHAMSWDENAARDYFRRLGHELHAIPIEGLYSVNQLDLAFDAKTDTFIFGDVAPTIIYFLAMYLMWAYIKKAMQDTEGKK